MLWVTTPSGRKWSLTQPRAEDVDIDDIARNLSLQVRFNGSLGAYTVAEHSVHCHDEASRRNLPKEWCLLALLHDAHEAYIGDIVTPLANALDVIVQERRGVSSSKPLVRDALEHLRNLHDEQIFTALGLDWNSLPGKAWFVLKDIDARAMMTERDVLGPAQPEPWGSYEDIPRLSFKPQCWDAWTARRKFLDRLSFYNYQAAELFTDIITGATP